MASRVQVANTALGLIGSKARIQDMDERSPEARYASLFFDDALADTLHDHPWKFATRVKTLALLDEPPTQLNWSYQYAYPTCLRVVRILPEATENVRQPFDVRLHEEDEVKVIWTNVQTAAAEIIVSVTDLNLWGRAALRALSWRLAAYLAMPVRGDVNIANAAERMYQVQIERALVSDGAESQHTERAPSEFERARA